MSRIVTAMTAGLIVFSTLAAASAGARGRGASVQGSGGHGMTTTRTRAEFAHAPAGPFERIDRNHDGFVDRVELAAFEATLPAVGGR